MYFPVYFHECEQALSELNFRFQPMRFSIGLFSSRRHTWTSVSVNFAEILAPFGLHKEYKRSAPRVIRHLSLVLIVWHNFSEVARHSEEILRGYLRKKFWLAHWHKKCFIQHAHWTSHHLTLPPFSIVMWSDASFTNV